MVCAVMRPEVNILPSISLKLPIVPPFSKEDALVAMVSAYLAILLICLKTAKTQTHSRS